MHLMSPSGQIRSRLLTGLVLSLVAFCVLISLGWRHRPSRTRSFSIVDLAHHMRSPIPPNIFQIYYGHTDLTSDLRRDMDSWLTLNPTHTYHRLSQAGAVDFLKAHYTDRPDLVDLYASLRVPALAADLLRYLVLAAQGGVYSDIDTEALKPVVEWVPNQLVQTVSAIVGVEYDRRKDGERLKGFEFDVQFCQWTIASAKNHPMLELAVSHVADALHRLAFEKGMAIEDLKPVDHEILTTTGPVLWTGVVIQSLSIASGHNVTMGEISGLRQPKLFGDILVLPISGFAIGVPHSGGRSVDVKEALVRHGFKGSWRHGWWQLRA